MYRNQHETLHEQHEQLKTEVKQQMKHQFRAYNELFNAQFKELRKEQRQIKMDIADMKKEINTFHHEMTIRVQQNHNMLQDKMREDSACRELRLKNMENQLLAIQHTLTSNTNSPGSIEK